MNELTNTNSKIDNCKQMYSAVETITPEIAKKYLEKSKGNPRYARSNKITNANTATAYANAMKKGHWELSAQGIIFDEDGILVDGHHRLRAIIIANVPVEMYVTRNQPKTTIAVDIGSKRALWQVAQMPSYTIGTIKAIESELSGMSVYSAGLKLDVRDIQKFYSDYKEYFDFSDSLTASHRTSKKRDGVTFNKQCKSGYNISFNER